MGTLLRIFKAKTSNNSQQVSSARWHANQCLLKEKTQNKFHLIQTIAPLASVHLSLTSLVIWSAARKTPLHSSRLITIGRVWHARNDELHLIGAIRTFCQSPVLHDASFSSLQLFSSIYAIGGAAIRAHMNCMRDRTTGGKILKS